MPAGIWEMWKCTANPIVHARPIFNSSSNLQPSPSNLNSSSAYIESSSAYFNPNAFFLARRPVIFELFASPSFWIPDPLSKWRVRKRDHVRRLGLWALLLRMVLLRKLDRLLRHRMPL